MRQLNLSHLALRKGLNTFACETTFRCSSTSRRTGTAKIAEPDGRLAFRPPGLNI